MKRTWAGRKRPAFTAVELLVVITIIAILAALVVAAASRVLKMQAWMGASSDITRMQQSLETARAAYGQIEYLPSKLRLFNDINVYRTTTDAEVKRSANVLRKMFGRRFITNGGTVTWGPAAAGTAGGATLTGSECLTFYLGGMTDVANRRCLGFSNNPLDPTASGGERIGPFYSFVPSRLSAGPSGTFFQYRDPWNTPYAFFGAYSPNNYDSTHAETFGASTVSPYGSSGNWVNPKTYQIISAGPNMLFGAGGSSWSPGNGYGDANNGTDDLANFSGAQLGEPQS
ncbi:MAG: prepilin-type N-terminal cleavage/methylation domain-containing protein [Gemmataceae bacterium]